MQKNADKANDWTATRLCERSGYFDFAVDILFLTVEKGGGVFSE